MKNLDTKINAFKVSLATARDIEEPWTYFFDELSRDKQFLAMGKTIDQKDVIQILQMIAVHALKNKGEIIHQQSFQIPEYKLIHGSSMIDQQWTVYCFLEDMDIGIACFLDPGSYHTHMIRFTMMKVDNGNNLDKAFVPHLKSSLLH